jgi:hypothetical protein
LLITTIELLDLCVVKVLSEILYRHASKLQCVSAAHASYQRVTCGTRLWRDRVVGRGDMCNWLIPDGAAGVGSDGTISVGCHGGYVQATEVHFGRVTSAS